METKQTTNKGNEMTKTTKLTDMEKYNILSDFISQNSEKWECANTVTTAIILCEKEKSIKIGRISKLARKYLTHTLKVILKNNLERRCFGIK